MTDPIDDAMSTFVVNLDDQYYVPINLGGQLLINVFDNKICRIAWRQNPWDSWGPPIEGEKRG